jgi:hypothetical protein
MAAGNDGLHQIAAPDLIDDDGRAPYQPYALPCADAESEHDCKDEPFVGPDRGECLGSHDRALVRRVDCLLGHCAVIAARHPKRRACSFPCFDHVGCAGWRYRAAKFSLRQDRLETLR